MPPRKRASAPQKISASIADVRTRYVQPKGTYVQPRKGLADVPAERLGRPLPPQVAVPERLRGADRYTLAAAWELAGHQWDRIQPGPNGTLVIH